LTITSRRYGQTRDAESADDRSGALGHHDAEYVALTQLQADAFVTLDAKLARRVAGIVPTATIDALMTPDGQVLRNDS
jgi:hypothetical protein